MAILCGEIILPPVAPEVLAAETLEVNDYPIISPAGSCTYAIKGYPTYLADEPQWVNDLEC